MPTSPNPPSSRLPRLGLVLVILGAIAAGAYYLIRPVALAVPAIRGLAVQSVPGSLEVKARFTMELKSAVGGRILDSELEPGKRVTRGDLLVQIDTGDVELEIERLQGEVTAARKRVELGSTLHADVANSKQAVAEFERLTKLGQYPSAELEKQRRLLQQLEQRLELDEVANKLALDNNENALRTKQREKDKMSIRAPADGIIITVNARAGDLIGGGSPIATLVSADCIVEAKISEENFAAVKQGQKATVRLLTYGYEQYPAEVTQVLPAADPATQRYTIFLKVTLPPERGLVPGITGEVSIVTAERARAVIIPRRALVGDYVYVAGNGRINVRQVKKGYESLRQVEIVSGLAEGDQVVVEEQDRLRDGDRVRVRQAQE